MGEILTEENGKEKMMTEAELSKVREDHSKLITETTNDKGEKVQKIQGQLLG